MIRGLRTWLTGGVIALACALSSANAQNAKPIVIGAAIAQSGFIAPYDADPTRAAQIAIEEINAKGGVLGRPLKLEIRDTKSDIAQGAVVAQELLALGARAIVVTGEPASHRANAAPRGRARPAYTAPRPTGMTR